MFTKTEQQFEQKTILRNDKAQKPKFVLETNISKIDDRFKISTKSGGLSFNTLGNQSSTTTQINKYINKHTKNQKLQTILRHHTLQGTMLIRFHPQEL